MEIMIHEPFIWCILTTILFNGKFEREISNPQQFSEQNFWAKKSEERLKPSNRFLHFFVKKKVV